MTAAARADGATATVGKKDLAEALGWSRPKLDRRLAEDAAFPVVSRGDQSGGWQFALAAVQRYLGGGPALERPKVKPSPAIDKAQLRDAVKPPEPRRQQPPRRSAHHEGEATARQRKDLADAQLKENKVRLENADLVESSEVRQILGEIFAGLGNDLDALPEEIVKRCDLSEDAAPAIRKCIDDVRSEMVRRAEPLLVEQS